LLHSPIVIVGAGVVAQALGRLLHLGGMPVVAVASRDRLHADQAAAFIGEAVRVATLAELQYLSSRVLVAVSDAAITPVAEALARTGMCEGVALHTCGAKGPEALAPLRAAGISCGVLHPLQTVVSGEQGVERLRGIAFGVTGDRAARDWAVEIVGLLDGQPLYVDAGQLSCYHAGAVLASNALVAALDAAVILMERAGIERQLALRALEPLSRTTLENVIRLGGRAALTGPVVRGDIGTVAAHLDALAAAPPTVDGMYRAVARHLVELARERGLSEHILQALESALDVRKATNEPSARSDH
jgi:predicted short-subunit dehydrogenase-like oxidoreductase (DUF2520 family)